MNQFLSIINSHKYNLFCLLLILFEKTYLYFSIFKHKSNYRNNSNLHLVNLLCARNLVTFTCNGTILFFWILIYDLFTPNYASNQIIWNYCWSILFSTTFGFYIYVYPLTPKKKNFSIKLLNYWSHGPYLLLCTFKLSTFTTPNNYDIFEEIYLCLGFSYLWFISIWFPWYYITGDYIYELLSNNLSLQQRFVNILKFKRILLLGIFIKYIVTN